MNHLAYGGGRGGGLAGHACDARAAAWGRTVRTPMVVEAQAPEAKARIEQAIPRGAEGYQQDDGNVVLRWPASVTVAERA